MEEKKYVYVKVKSDLRHYINFLNDGSKDESGMWKDCEDQICLRDSEEERERYLNYSKPEWRWSWSSVGDKVIQKEEMPSPLEHALDGSLFMVAKGLVIMGARVSDKVLAFTVDQLERKFTDDFAKNLAPNGIETNGRGEQMYALLKLSEYIQKRTDESENRISKSLFNFFHRIIPFSNYLAKDSVGFDKTEGTLSLKVRENKLQCARDLMAACESCESLKECVDSLDDQKKRFLLDGRLGECFERICASYDVDISSLKSVSSLSNVL